jgi:hypothetical protein
VINLPRGLFITAETSAGSSFFDLSSDVPAPSETALRGWACRTRTRKCQCKRCHLKCGANSLGFRSILGPETFRGWAAKRLTCASARNRLQRDKDVEVNISLLQNA